MRGWVEDPFGPGVARRDWGRRVLATVVRRSGSAPPPLGARLVVREDGSTSGTVGGGCLEAEVWQEAKALIGGSARKRLAFRLDGSGAAEEGPVCGGRVEVLLEPAPCGRAQEEVLRAAERARSEGHTAVVATVLPRPGEGLGVEESPPLLLADDGSEAGVSPCTGREGEALLAAMRAAMGGEEPGLVEMGVRGPGGRTIRREVLIEPVTPPPAAFVFGAGHVSVPLASLAHEVGFRVVVADDREEFASRGRFPQADDVVVGDLAAVVRSLPITPASFVVIVTRGHRHDTAVLEQALRTQARYIGMIGSRRKVALAFKELRARGVPDEALRRVCAPIGLDIGARTPEEIALSVVAEMVAERRGADGMGCAPLSRHRGWGRRMSQRGDSRTGVV